MTWYRLFQLLARPLLHVMARMEVKGLENIPTSGPFILVANHQSFLDPIVVQALCPRPLHTLAKSTQFAGTIMGWVMPKANAIPTRRYRIEPQAVRVVLRHLEAGDAVGVYPEGERSWDARIQPFRRGTIRLLLKAGVPVVPCGVTGIYDVLPRWSKTLRRSRVRVEFGRPLQWPAMHDRDERNAFLPQAAEVLRRTLEDLSGWEPRAEGGWMRTGERNPEKEELPAWLKPAATRD